MDKENYYKYFRFWNSSKLRFSVFDKNLNEKFSEKNIYKF